MLASSESVFCIKFLFKKIFKVSETNSQSEPNKSFVNSCRRLMSIAFFKIIQAWVFSVVF